MLGIDYMLNLKFFFKMIHVCSIYIISFILNSLFFCISCYPHLTRIMVAKQACVHGYFQLSRLARKETQGSLGAPSWMTKK